MASGDNKCAACGRWSGKGHKCPTPTLYPGQGRIENRPAGADEASQYRAEVSDRTSAAAAYLQASEQPAQQRGYTYDEPATDYTQIVMTEDGRRDPEAETRRIWHLRADSLRGHYENKMPGNREKALLYQLTSHDEGERLMTVDLLSKDARMPSSVWELLTKDENRKVAAIVKANPQWVADAEPVTEGSLYPNGVPRYRSADE